MYPIKLSVYLAILSKYLEEHTYDCRILSMSTGGDNGVVMTGREFGPSGGRGDDFILTISMDDDFENIHIRNINGDDCLDIDRDADNMTDEEFFKMKADYVALAKKVSNLNVF